VEANYINMLWIRRKMDLQYQWRCCNSKAAGSQGNTIYPLMSSKSVMDGWGILWPMTGHLKRATLTEMCRWILEAWQSISQDMIAKSWKVTGISNKMDGSEDDFLWHQSNEESCQEDTTDSEED
jgi:hypothetical protein